MRLLDWLCVLCVPFYSGWSYADYATPCQPAEHCLLLGEELSSKHIKHLRRGKLNQKHLCESFLQFEECINTLVKSYPSYSLVKHWQRLYADLSCICFVDQHPSQECLVSSTCIEEQRLSVFYQACNTIYNFNIQQTGHAQCVFTAQRSKCELSIISSACGSAAKRFYNDLLMATGEHMDIACPTRLPDDLLPTFQHNSSCPTNLQKLVGHCANKHPAKETVRFENDNELIPTSNKRALENCCKSYNSYRECRTKHELACPEGMDRLMAMNPQSRMYNMIMDYICDNQDFITNVKCYQRTEKRGFYDDCKQLLVEQHVQLSAFQFFCENQNLATTKLLRILQDLRKCYFNITTQSCYSESSAQAFDGLLERVFKDPTVLKLGYFTPDCELLRYAQQYATSTVNMPTTTTIATTSATILTRTTTTVVIDTSVEFKRTTINSLFAGIESVLSVCTNFSQAYLLLICFYLIVYHVL